MYKVSSSSTKCMLSGAPGRLERVRAFSEVLCQPHLHHSEVLVLVVLVDKGKGHSGNIQGKNADLVPSVWSKFTKPCASLSPLAPTGMSHTELPA